MIAATIIAKNPEKFGFKNVPYLPPAKFEKVPVTEPTSLTAAAVAVNVPSEELAGLNPELLRGVTPPEAQSYQLNLPPNSREQFTKNITIARIEHPAVASAPIRTASRSSERSYSSSNGKSASSRQASVAPKSNGKSRGYAKASKKAAGQTYAKHEQSTHSTPVKSGAAPVVQASLFGTPSLASKNGDAKKTKTALIGTPKSQAKGQAAKSKKSEEARLVKKNDNSSKSTAKAKKNGRSKDKVSKAKSPRALMVSEAR
jgi:hypothetical protein